MNLRRTRAYLALFDASLLICDVLDAARNLSDRRTLDSDGFWVSQKEMRALDLALARLDAYLADSEKGTA